MSEKLTISCKNELSWILTFDAKIISISKSFSIITEFNIEELIGKSINELWTILRVNPAIDCDAKSFNDEHFIITKSNSQKSVIISLEVAENSEHAIYIIKEKVDMEFEKKFPIINQVLKENLRGMAVFKMPGIILVKANRSYLDLLDEPFNSEDISCGRYIGDIVTGWRGSTSEEIWEELIRTQKSLKIDEYRYDRFNRGESYFNASYTPIFEDGKLKYYVELVSDITEAVLNRKKVEEQNSIIKEQNQKLEGIIENISDSVIMVSKNGELSRVSRVAREVAPKNFEDRLEDWFNTGKYFDEGGNEIELNGMPAARLARGETIRNMYLMREDGKNQIHIMVSGAPVCDENGEFIYGIMCSRNVTDHVNKQREIYRHMDSFYKITSNLDVPILRLSYPELKIIDFNKKLYESFREMDGRSPLNTDRLKMGESLSDLRERFSNYIILKKIEEAAQTKNIVYIDRIDTMQKGKRKVCKLILQPLLGINGDVSEIIMTSYDITNIVEEKEGLENLLKMQEEFFSFISHEFKTPLSVISCAVQTMELLCKKELSERGASLLGTIKRSTLQQLRLVTNLLDITKADAGYLKLHKKNMNIAQMTELIINSVEPFAAEKGVSIDFQADEDIIISIDDEKYERILLNLLSNAIKFTPQNKNIYVDIFREEDRVFIEVKDEGIGIPKEKQQMVFNRFEQSENGYIRNSNGTGIGLCLVKLLVEAMDGCIEIESEVSVGTSFRIHLPFETIEQEEATKAYNLLDNRLIELRNIEFSNIYLD